MRKKDKAINDCLASLYKLQQQAILHCDNVSEYVVGKVLQIENLRELKDHLGKTLLHILAEQGNLVLCDALLAYGSNPNAKEGCGTTPLHLAVVNNNVEICRLLTENCAMYEGPLFSDIPSPLKVACIQELDEIIQLFDPTDSN